MFNTILIYLSLIIFTIFGAYISSKYESKRPIGFLLMFILIWISIIIGGRYEVGTDWPNYLDLYYSILNYGITFNSSIFNGYEPLYLMLNAIFAFFDLSPSIFFTGVALLQFVLLCKAVDNKKIIPWVIFFFFTQLFAMSLNIQRQMIAVGFFLLATKYLDKSKVVYLVLVLCATLFHYSSIILFPLVFINNHIFSFLENRVIAILLFFATLIFSEVFLGILNLSSMGDLLSVSDKYVKNLDAVDIEMDVSSGYGIIARNLMAIVSIYYMPHLLNFYKNVRLSSIYRLFIIGLLLSNIFEISMFLSRIPLALVSLKVLIYPLLCRYWFRKKTHPLELLIGIGFILLHLAMFIMSIVNNDSGISPYNFKWL